MRIALLGTDADILTLAAAACQAGHSVVWVADVRPKDRATLDAYVPRPTFASSDEWETVLDQATADAVLVGRGLADDELRAEQLKRLADDAVPTLAVFPVVASVLTYYEVDMVRREKDAIVQHYNPWALHPLVSDLAGWAREGDEQIGPICQVTCQRRVAGGERQHVLECLARDVELLAAVAGSVRQVSAVGPSAADASAAAIQAQMTTAGPTLHWSTAPPSAAVAEMELALVGERGVMTVLVPDSRAAWQLEIAGQENREAFAPVEHDPAAAAIARFEAAVAGQADATAADSTWDKATQAMEVVDAVQLSLQKGRTIEVHQQQLTQQLAFRGTMAAAGCGLLLLGFGVLVVTALLGGIEAVINQRLMASWPIIMLAVLCLFLLLQAVPFLAAKPRRRPDAD